MAAVLTGEGMGETVAKSYSGFAARGDETLCPWPLMLPLLTACRLNAAG